MTRLENPPNKKLRPLGFCSLPSVKRPRLGLYSSAFSVTEKVLRHALPVASSGGFAFGSVQKVRSKLAREEKATAPPGNVSTF